MVNNSLTILRSLLFPKGDICQKDALYFRSENGSSVYCEEEQQLHIEGTVSFDTYFNILPLSWYKEYCSLSELFLRLKIGGEVTLRIYGVSGEHYIQLFPKRKYDLFHPDPEKLGGSFEEELLLTKELSHSSVSECIIDLTWLLDSDHDFLYFTLSGKHAVCSGGELLCGSDVKNGVSIAAVICTYRRESFLLRNHREITEYLHQSTVFHPNNIHFYIVDNGKTLNSALIENEYVSLIPNNNTGGSGGFARGYYEAVSSGKHYTHILFMDDDMILDSEMLLRIYSLLRLRKAAYQNLSAGASMLKLSDRSTLHEAAAFWNGKQLTSIGNGLDMTNRDHVFTTACLPEGNYHAWWFYCFPANWQEIHGYPLPFFIKEDDIEYSLRCADHIASLCGIAVWHEDFDNKYDGFQEYYIKRNELILTSVCRQKPYAAFQIRKLILSVMKQTVFQRYFLADLIFRSYKDYLKGWKHFYLTNTIELNKELMASCAPLLSDEELQEKYGVSFDIKKYERSLQEPENLKKQALTLNGYLIPTAFYRHDKDDFSICDLAKCRIVNFYRHKRVLHYDTNQKKGFVTVIKKRMLIKNIFRLIGLSCRFLICYPFVRRGYRRHMKELTSSEIHSFSPTPETLPVDLPVKKS